MFCLFFPHIASQKIEIELVESFCLHQKTTNDGPTLVHRHDPPGGSDDGDDGHAGVMAAAADGDADGEVHDDDADAGGDGEVHGNDDNDADAGGDGEVHDDDDNDADAGGDGEVHGNDDDDADGEVHEDGNNDADADSVDKTCSTCIFRAECFSRYHAGHSVHILPLILTRAI